MKLNFLDLQSNRYVMSPNLEKGNRLSFVEKGCSHYFVFSAKRGQTADFHSEKFHIALEKLGNDLCSCEKTKDKMIDGFPGFRVSCFDRNSYLREGSTIQLPQRAAAYWVFGGFYKADEDLLEIYFPENIPQALNTIVSVGCMIAQVEEVKKGFFRKVSTMTDFYAVQIENMEEYYDGGIVYQVEGCQLEGQPIEYRVTKDMIGKRFFVRARDGRPPRFISKIQGLELNIRMVANMVVPAQK